ncbi:hypothetical protein FSARC_4604 [Fusarium sarcochroum]|uniref:Amidophosphoribosyltransferase n=1 Tax=Fusarium sarcochroum TaxID=1208366 RepID=A0A8H4U169_9HYPO|nr:hypothetical protein FSARC_4604 [Fusarium sarcochroum]
MCGVSAILLGDPDASSAAIELHESLYYLQHVSHLDRRQFHYERGQDAAGIAVCQGGGRVSQCKGLGMASKVFSEGRRLEHLPGYMGLGHVRYPTHGTASASEAQPFYVNAPFGISMSVNGNLVNTEYLRKFLDEEAHRHVNSDSDSELLLNIFAHGLEKLGKTRANSEDIFTALEDVYSKCQGAFASTAMIAGFGILAFRDANGIRPLCIGSRPSATLPGTKDYFVASESVVLKQLGFEDIVDILPGQACFLQKGCEPKFRQIINDRPYTPDCFEFVYVARPDSTMDGISVYRSRQNMGEKLAKKIKAVLGEKGVEEIDAVIPVPETSNIAAATLAEKLGKPYVTALIKNRYVQRTFILPNQALRQKSVRRKLSPIDSEFKGKNLIIVDDSVVRGTTSRQIVQMARDAGAVRVIFVSASPECIHPHIYGIDLADPVDLVAHGRTGQEIAEYIGADEVIFQDLDGPDGLKAACMEAADSTSKVRDFEVGVFCGKYVTDIPEGYFEHLSELRNGKKAKAALNNIAAGGDDGGNVVVSSGPTNGPADADEREDISLHNIASDEITMS